MALSIKNSNRFLLILNVLILAFVIFQQVINLKQSKTGYIDNQKVFDAFLGKKDLALKLQRIKLAHQHQFDSLKKMLLSSNNVETSKILEEKSILFSEQEAELTNRYTTDIWRQINGSITEFGKLRGFEFIHGATGDGTLMYADKTLDISDEVILYINNKYKGD
jgi:outer membrane protein